MKINIISLLFFVILFALVRVVSAAVIINENNNTVINNVSVQANSGERVYNNGEMIKTGESSAAASVYTQVNGEVVQDVNEQATSSAEVRINLNSEVKADKGKVRIDTNLENHSVDENGNLKESKKEIKKQIDLNVKKTDKQAERVKINVVPEPINSFWQSLIKLLKSFFSLFS